MNIWEKIWGKKKPIEDNYTSDARATVEYFYNGNEEVREEEARQIPAFEACLNLITNTLSQLDFKLIKKDGKDVTEIKDDYRLKFLNKEPNDEMSGVTFKKALIKDYLLYGEGIIKIERDLNTIKSLYYIPAKKTNTEVFTYDGYKKYSEVTLTNSYGTTYFNDYDLMRVLRNSPDGFRGIGLISENIPLLKLALKELNYSNDVFNNGAMPSGVLSTPNKLTDEAFRRLTNSWREKFSGAKNVGKTVVLEGGVEYKKISMNPDELQLSDMKKNIISEICRIFGVPESMINNSANKYNSNERNNIYFLQYCLSPIISAMEASANKNLLLESEKNDYQFIVDTSNILKLTQSELVDVVSKEFNNGLISFNEAREKINKNSVEESEDYYKASLGSVFYKYNQDEFIVPNTLDKNKEELGGDYKDGNTET